jgi:hypothetical protein
MLEGGAGVEPFERGIGKRDEHTVGAGSMRSKQRGTLTRLIPGGDRVLIC